MKPAPTFAAAAALSLALSALSWGTVPRLAAAQPSSPSPIVPSEDLANTPSPPLAPTVREQAQAAAPIPGIELWRGARLGMTLDQVKTLLPTGYPPGPVGSPAKMPAQDDGTQPLWQMPDQVYGRAGVATFFFRNGRLASLTVDLNGVKPHATNGNMEDARTLEKAFSGYYGKPTLCIDSKARGLDQVDCRWQGHGLRIGLSYQDFGGASPYMAIAIRPVPPPPRAKSPFFGKRARKSSTAS